MKLVLLTNDAPRVSPGPRLSPVTLIVAGALVAAAMLAWVWLLLWSGRGDGQAMPGMAASPPDASLMGYLLPAFVMWVIMMVAMMVPAAAPMVLLYARLDRGTSKHIHLAHTLVFISAYILVWAVFSAAAATAQTHLVEIHAVSASELKVRASSLSAELLLAAAFYELTAAKQLCLDRCQSPLMFFARYWRPGAASAFRLGLIHGWFCLGCCWMLMLLLFIGGVMNLAWVALLGIVVVGEKFAPPRWHANRWGAALLVAIALAMLILR